MAVDVTLVRDVVLVVPGIMGSELVDREGRALWAVTAGSLARAIRTLGKSLRELELPAGIGDEPPRDGVRATRLINSLHVIPGIWSPIIGYDGLLAFLRSKRFHTIEPVAGDDSVVPNLISFPYDWRLSNRYNGRLLAKVAVDALERWRRQPGMREAKLVLICHSMGGLVARWFAEQEGGGPLIRALVTIGTPHRGSLKALDTLVNGLEPGIGPLRIPLTSFARSLPALYQLLPQYNCIEVGDGKRAGIAAAGCPEVDVQMLADATAFHDAINGAKAPEYALQKVVGIRQPTLTTARLRAGGIVTSCEIDERDQGGDGTVPRLSAEPEAGRGHDVFEIANQHGVLQGTPSLLDLVDGILSRQEIVWQDAPSDTLAVDMNELFTTRDEPGLQVKDLDDRRLAVTVSDETGEILSRTIVAPDGRASLGRLAEGGYHATIASDLPDGPAPVSKPFLVLDPTSGDV
jgi:pimeloyl-ACP methyl ester carboxylesterase